MRENDFSSGFRYFIPNDQKKKCELNTTPGRPE